VNEILADCQVPHVILLRDYQYLDCSLEYLKKYYKKYLIIYIYIIIKYLLKPKFEGKNKFTIGL
jgi:hypothetical protein